MPSPKEVRALVHGDNRVKLFTFSDSWAIKLFVSNRLIAEVLMKKGLLAALCFLLVSIPCLAAPPVIGFVTGSSGLGDLSFNDMAYGGIRRAQQEYNFKLVVLEPKQSGKSSDEDVLGVVEQSDVVILLGAQHTELAKNAARANPDKKFILVEVPVEDIPNISSVMFQQHEGSFLAGALAGYMTKTGKVGFIGGTVIAPVQAFEQGYREGVTYANPDVQTLVEYTSPAGDFSGFSNPQKGHQQAMGQYEQGADIIFAVAGLTGNGVIEAARRTGNYAIGVDSDQDSLAKGFVLTSMIKRLDEASYNELKKALEGSFSPGVTYYGLKDGGVSLSDMKYTRDKIPAEILKKVDDIKAKIINGEITVTNLLPTD